MARQGGRARRTRKGLKRSNIFQANANREEEKKKVKTTNSKENRKSLQRPEGMPR